MFVALALLVSFNPSVNYPYTKLTAKELWFWCGENVLF